MTYGKIENGTLVHAPNRIILQGMQIFNPLPGQLAQAGYKEIQYTDLPEEAPPEGKRYEAQYQDAGETITQSWVLAEDKPAETGKTMEQRVTALEQGQAELKNAIERGLAV